MTAQQPVRSHLGVVADMRRVAREDAVGIASGGRVEALEKAGLLVVRESDLHALCLALGSAVRASTYPERRAVLADFVRAVGKP